ncbi:MAG: type III pantothenate kinase [Candidatus Methylacidiphilales bacterium]
MKSRILLLDAGNSGVKAAVCTMRRNRFGLIQHGAPRKVRRVETASVTEEWLKECALTLCLNSGTGSENASRLTTVPVAFSSVVPRVTELIRQVFPGKQSWQVKATEDLGWQLNYPDRANLGGDRICSAAAARALRADLGGNIVAIDFGTATTFNVVNAKGAFIGGVIAPGFNMMLSYLHEKTALLPKLEPAPHKRTIGRNTREAMQAAVVPGYIGMIRQLIFSIFQELQDSAKAKHFEEQRNQSATTSAVPEFAVLHCNGTNPPGLEGELPAVPFSLIATGGHAKLLAKQLPEISEFRPYLNLEGLAIMAAHAMNRGKLGA